MTDPTRVQQLERRMACVRHWRPAEFSAAVELLYDLADAWRRQVALAADMEAALREFARLDDEGVLLAKEGYGGELVSALHDARALSLSAAPPPPDGENP